MSEEDLVGIVTRLKMAQSRGMGADSAWRRVYEQDVKKLLADRGVNV